MMKSLTNITLGILLSVSAVPVHALSESAFDVKVSDTTLQAQTVSKGTANVKVLSLDFEAGCGDALYLEQITLVHEGTGKTEEIEGLYAASNGTVLTRKKNIDPADLTVTLVVLPGLVIAPCGHATVDIMADVLPSAKTGSSHSFLVELSSDILTDAKDGHSGNFPLRGGIFTVKAPTLRNLCHRSDTEHTKPMTRDEARAACRAGR